MRHGALVATVLLILVSLAALPAGSLAQTDETTDEPARLFIAFCEQIRCVFNATDAHLPDTQITAYEWDLGDGSTAEGEIVNHVYENAGTYNVTLTVHGDEGSTLTETRDIDVDVERPEAPNEIPWAALTMGAVMLVLAIALARFL